MLTVEPLIAYADCGYCALTQLTIFFIVCMVGWTVYCIYKVKKHRIYRPFRTSLYMLIGYILTTNILTLLIAKDAMRDDDGLKYMAVLVTGTFACITPIAYGVIFHLITWHKNKKRLVAHTN